MKHTNFYGKYREIEAQERREIKAAVLAHGGEYVFIPEDDEDYMENDNVTIMAGRRYSDTNKDFFVSRLSVDKDGELHIFGFDTEYDTPSDEDELSNIEYGHLESILDAIPETEEVHDVREVPTENEKSILVLSREDVESVGYDPNMTDDQFQRLAWAMGKAYEFNMDMYWDALQQSCEHVGLTPINKDETDDE